MAHVFERLGFRATGAALPTELKLLCDRDPDERVRDYVLLLAQDHAFNPSLTVSEQEGALQAFWSEHRVLYRVCFCRLPVREFCAHHLHLRCVARTSSRSCSYRPITLPSHMRDVCVMSFRLA